MELRKVVNTKEWSKQTDNLQSLSFLFYWSLCACDWDKASVKDMEDHAAYQRKGTLNVLFAW